ncbi:hypothetical protein [Peribacillus frigoritolerans]|uniref:hypothetical protein n=1 Tax=Peribacillus frigoritolerans TaxID=450367 RepID=UPI002E9F7491|nr:hypothetical protein [Peribacillus frigoritolerans]
MKNKDNGFGIVGDSGKKQQETSSLLDDDSIDRPVPIGGGDPGPPDAPNPGIDLGGREPTPHREPPSREPSEPDWNSEPDYNPILRFAGKKEQH